MRPQNCLALRLYVACRGTQCRFDIFIRRRERHFVGCSVAVQYSIPIKPDILRSLAGNGKDSKKCRLLAGDTRSCSGGRQNIQES